MDQPVINPEHRTFEKAPDPMTPGPETGARRRHRFSLAGAVVVLAILIGLGFALYHAFAPKPASNGTASHAGAAAQPVGAATLARADVDIVIEALGTVTPLANVTVKTQINGQLTQVGFTEGQIVKKDDFLAQIDPRPYQALLDQYEGQLARDEGLLAQAKFDLARYQTLAAEKSIATQTADDQKFLVQQDEGLVRGDQGLIETEKVNLAFCHITAPVTGRVGLRQVDPGNFVQTTDANGIVVLTQLQPISVVFSMPENIVPSVVAATKTNANLDAEAYDQANTTHLATGHLSALDNVIDTTTGMLKARAIFDNADDSLIPNQFVNLHLKTGVLKNVVTAPNAAVQRGSSGTFAYVIGADDKVSVRKIALGPTQGDIVAITSGLDAGERVVIDGSDRLRDGMRVSVVPESPATAKDAAPKKSAPKDAEKP
ncbi:MAG: efflux RND transporter periplasmic adaptor subunit [Beijerinckiaceae bacterium]|nr:efflux RND transporter periplasmic adaptor subunit [Beijerinckiaceae bacterium]